MISESRSEIDEKHTADTRLEAQRSTEPTSSGVSIGAWATHWKCRVCARVDIPRRLMDSVAGGCRDEGGNGSQYGERG